jgi:hypothetical protein
LSRDFGAACGLPHLAPQGPRGNLEALLRVPEWEVGLIDELAGDVIVVRGGNMTAAQLLARARKDHGRLGRYGISAFAGGTPSMTAADIVSEATIPHKVIRTATVERIRAAGFEISWSFARPHCTIDVGPKPTEARVLRLLSAFDPPIPNPGLRGEDDQS